MGGAPSKEEPPGDADDPRSTTGVSSMKPYFFLASCPDDSLQEAIGLADAYGGFHCIGDKDDGFEAWKGRAAGQFLTLKRLSPAGRKVVGIAIAGFGHCNDERDFLRQLGARRGHEQFELKQCGDVRDMERWLQSEGYSAGPEARPPPEESGRTQAAGASGTAGAAGAGRPGLWASVTSFFGGEGAPPGAWKERWLMDVQHALAGAEAADEANAEAMGEAAAALAAALQNARGAGVPDADLEAAARRLEELQELARAAERRRCCCPCWCCCTEARGWRRLEEPQETQLVFATGGADARAAEAAATKASASGQAEEHDKKQMMTVLPFRARGDPLPPGTKCRYKSPRNGWLAAVMEGFNPCDGTCNLDIKKHAKPENIFPAVNVSEAQAWPVGTLVEYQSSSAGRQWLEATIRAFNEGVGGNDCSYNLDLRERAAVDRIRLRIE